METKRFIQVLEGVDYARARVVALIDAPVVVQVVQQALIAYFQTRKPAPAAQESYMRRYGKTLKALSKDAGLTPTVVSTRLRRGWSLREALKTAPRPRRRKRKRAEAA